MTTKNKQDKAMPYGGTLERTLGSTATTRILDFLSIHTLNDHSKLDIARYSDVSPRHAAIAIEKLEKLGIIKNTRTVGRAQMYIYNQENKASELFLKLAHTLSMIETDNLTEEDFHPKSILPGQKPEKQSQNKVLVEVPA